MTDRKGRELHVNDTVVFIANATNNPILLEGVITRISEKNECSVQGGVCYAWYYSKSQPCS